MAVSTQAAKVGAMICILVLGSYAVWKGLGSEPAGSNGYDLETEFINAQGLKEASVVVVAGLPVGEITELYIVNNRARVRLRVRREIDVWSNAIAAKRASSLLGGFYIQIDPGQPNPPSASGELEPVELLGKRGENDTRETIPNFIKNAREATTPEELMRRIEESLPHIDKVFISVEKLSEELRQVVAGPVRKLASRVDQLVEEETDTVKSILARLDTSLANIEKVTESIRGSTASGEIDNIIKNIEDASLEAKTLIQTAKDEVAQTGATLRAKLDRLDGSIDGTQSIIDKIDQDQGTLGRLVNDSTLADNLTEISDDVKDFVGTITDMQTYVGLRTEYNVFSQLARYYVTVELHTRPDKYYLLELSKGPRGARPKISLSFDPSLDPNNYIRTTTIDDEIRVSFMYAKRWGPATFRYGLKDSTGGVGLDLQAKVWGKQLQMSFDGFDAGFDRLPRIKATAMLQVFRNFYILGGIDDALNTPQRLPINNGNLENPNTLDTLRFGRDYFLGFLLRFNDEDLATLLTVGGGAAGGLSNNNN